MVTCDTRDPVFVLDQARHGRARPEIERQLQLIGHPAHDQGANAAGPLRAQTAFARSATPALELERAQAAIAVELHPFAHGPRARAKRVRGFGLCHAAADRLHHLAAQQVLRRGVQLSRINGLAHAP